MGAKFTLCCWEDHLKHDSEEEKAILRMQTSPASRPSEPLSSESSDSDTEAESIFGSGSTMRSQWSRGNKHQTDYSRGLDTELQAFISMRDQADKATEEWEKLNYDIHTLRYTRREVRSRWKKILLQLGYQCEVDSLLDVNKQTRYSRDQEHFSKAIELLKQLLENTCLFPPGTGHNSRYLYVMDRLVSLDSADDFVKLAKEKYPKKDA